MISELDESIETDQTIAEMGLYPLAVDGAQAAPCEMLQEAKLKTAVGGKMGLPVQVLYKPLGQSIKAIHQTPSIVRRRDNPDSCSIIKGILAP
jgi:hypothetical protein